MRRLAPISAFAALALSSSSLVLVAPFDNTLTGLIPDLYAALDVVSRELVGFVPGVTRSTGAERAALGEAVTYPVSNAVQGYDITPAMTTPEPPDQNVGLGKIQLTKSRAYPFGFVAEQEKALNNGPGYLTLQGDLIAQALRAIVNEVENDVANAAVVAGSRATGTPGTTPFGTNLGDSAQLRKILDDNGAPLSERSMVINTATGANLRTLGQITKVNEAGTQMTLRDGQLMDLHGFAVRESAFQNQTHVKGTASGATTNAGGYAVGSTVITLAAAGTGTILAGDVITFAGDLNKYVVIMGDSDVSNGGTFQIGAPGLRVAIPAAATAITVQNSFAVNVGFSRNAMALALRPPAKPDEGDMRIDDMVITDPRSGLSFEISMWPGYRKVRFEVAAVWGVKAIKPEHIAILMG